MFNLSKIYRNIASKAIAFIKMPKRMIINFANEDLKSKNEENQMSLHKQLIFEQMKKASDSPMKLLDFYDSKGDTLNISNKVEIISRISYLLYKMKYTDKLIKTNYKGWLLTTRKDQRFQKIISDLENNLAKLSLDEMSKLCNFCYILKNRLEFSKNEYME